MSPLMRLNFEISGHDHDIHSGSRGGGSLSSSDTDSNIGHTVGKPPSPTSGTASVAEHDERHPQNKEQILAQV